MQSQAENELRSFRPFLNRQLATGIAVAVFSWYGMMAVHEAGHCLGAVATGARIDAVDVPLVGFSRTDFSGGRWPLLVVWSGPVLGAVLPAALLGLTRVVGARTKHALHFFVGFCLLANGAYIGLGAFTGEGDCRQLREYGSPAWLMIAFGVVALAAGLYTWHRMGPVRGWFRGHE